LALLPHDAHARFLMRFFSVFPSIAMENSKQKITKIFAIFFFFRKKKESLFLKIVHFKFSELFAV